MFIKDFVKAELLCVIFPPDRRHGEKVWTVGDSRDKDYIEQKLVFEESSKNRHRRSNEKSYTVVQGV